MRSFARREWDWGEVSLWREGLRGGALLWRGAPAAGLTPNAQRSTPSLKDFCL